VLADWTDEEARTAAQIVQRLTESLGASTNVMKPAQQQPAAAAV
jgi:hypothetical protein